ESKASQAPDFIPERFEVAIIQREWLDVFLAAYYHRSLEECAGGVQLIQLAGVTGKIVRDGRFVGKFFESGSQRLPGGAQPSVRSAAQSIGMMQPGTGPVGRKLQQLARGFERRGPAVLRREDSPAGFQNIRMILERSGDLFEFGQRLDGIAQFEPPNSRRQPKLIGWLHRFHPSATPWTLPIAWRDGLPPACWTDWQYPGRRCRKQCRDPVTYE